jgi:hypothetical protein
MNSTQWKLPVLAALTAVTALVLFVRPVVHQSLSYHNFADQRTCLGVPHFANVVSNLPFLVIGIGGVVFTARTNGFIAGVERWPWLVFFLGVALTAFGSTYYHLAPGNDRLVWDRLPMAVAFMGLSSGMIMERIGVKAGLVLLGPLVVLGVGSVLYWAEYDDLRPYYFVQFYPGVAIPLMLLLFPARYTGTAHYFVALGFYVAGKFCEYPYDAAIYHVLGDTVSGHTLKHLLAGASVLWLLVLLTRREPISGGP